LFQEFNGFDNNPVTVIAGNPGTGLAVNHGYHSDSTTAITVTAWSGVNPAATADAGARLEFVAEMAEVMMDLRNKRRQATSWNPGGSNGEGLSQFLAEMFYRSAYYDSQLQHGPSRITGWLNESGRPDWVTTTEATDQNFVSFGYDFLFLHFLHTQKGYSVQGAVHQHPLARFEVCHLGQCRVRGRGVGQGRHGCCRADPGAVQADGHRRVRHGHRGVAPFCAGAGQGHHRPVGLEARRAVAQRADGAGHLQPGHVRRLRQASTVLVQALADVDIDQADGGMCDIDGHLARPGTGSGSSVSSKTSGPPKRVTTAARMAWPSTPSHVRTC